MTIEKLLQPAPQDQQAYPTTTAPTLPETNDLESLVRALSKQAKAADARSAELAERISLLESSPADAAAALAHNGNNNTDTAAVAAAPAAAAIMSARPLANGRFGSTRVAFTNQQSTQDISMSSTRSIRQGGEPSNNDHLITGQGAPQDNINNDEEEGALSTRMHLIERRLDDYEEKKETFDENKYALPESTFSLLVTHHPLSVPFAFGVFSMVLSISCLSLTLASAISKGVNGNALGIPAGVDGTVRVAQFLGVIVGVLMEDEIPQGLQLIANGVGHKLLLNGKKPVHYRVIVSSIFRLVVGYLFLTSLFINIAQNDDVIEIFYDVLALEFVENIDDTSFALAKRGFFGRSMLIATNQKYNLHHSGMGGIRGSALFGSRNNTNNAPLTPSMTERMTDRRLSFSGLIASNNRVNHFVRLIYFLNAAIILGALGYIAQIQKNGDYRCNTINVLFDEVIWENAHVQLPDGSIEERLLMYSYFNGIYKEDGGHDGYPKYIEQNKGDGTAFGSSVIGAEIVYCNEIGSWVFRHPLISTTPNGRGENECSWLWRSPQTEDHNILMADNQWEAWIGKVQPFAEVLISCNECSERSDCNYHGSCEENNVCKCDESYFGGRCEFDTPCESLATEKSQRYDPVEGMQWKQDKPIREVVGHRVYNRPVYIQKGLSGEPYDMRLYNILEKEKSSPPSNTPSNVPSISNAPTQVPTLYPTFTPTTSFPSSMPSTGYRSDGKVSSPPTGAGRPLRPFIPPVPLPYPETEPIYYGEDFSPAPTVFPTGPRHNQNEYDTAPDFADWDDFFESQALHNLEDILKDYSVVISYTGSRFYGTIIEPDASLDDIFHSDYHAFWSESLDGDRTFIISDTTSASSPVGADFFEMRRRTINPLFNENIRFSYGPFGALIPLMNYEGTGFFNCLDETPHPSTSPSSSAIPTSNPSISISPTAQTCFWVEVNISNGRSGNFIYWYISEIKDDKEQTLEDVPPIAITRRFFEPDTRESRRECLYKGDYEFSIVHSVDDIWYTLASLESDGTQITGGRMHLQPVTKFSVPALPKPPS